MPTEQKKCKELVADHWKSVCEDIQQGLNSTGEENPEIDLYEYGLCFDWKEPNENNGYQGYYCYLISYGGPSEEIRMYHCDGSDQCYKIEYWYMDWFDGASVDITDDQVAKDFWDFWSEIAPPKINIE